MNLGIKDNSLENSQQIFQIQIFSYDKNPSNILPEFDLEKIGFT